MRGRRRFLITLALAPVAALVAVWVDNYWTHPRVLDFSLSALLVFFVYYALSMVFIALGEKKDRTSRPSTD